MITELNDITDIKHVGKNALFFYIPGHCAGCKMVSNLLSQKEPKNWTIYKINSENPAFSELLKKFNVTSAPTLVLFNDVDITERIVGLKEFLSKKELFE